jgi:hypothetical protein
MDEKRIAKLADNIVASSPLRSRRDYGDEDEPKVAGRTSRSIDVSKAIRLVKSKRMQVVSAGPGRTHSFDQRGALHEVESANDVSAELFDNGGVIFTFGRRFDGNFIEFE